MAESMVERVARAICRAHGKWIEDDSWRIYQDEARAAIEAMREPTDAMMRQMEIAGGAGMRGVWWMGVDAALNEQVSG